MIRCRWRVWGGIESFGVGEMISNLVKYWRMWNSKSNWSLGKRGQIEECGNGIGETYTKPPQKQLQKVEIQRGYACKMLQSERLVSAWKWTYFILAWDFRILFNCSSKDKAGKITLVCVCVVFLAWNGCDKQSTGSATPVSSKTKNYCLTSQLEDSPRSRREDLLLPCHHKVRRAVWHPQITFQLGREAANLRRVLYSGLWSLAVHCAQGLLGFQNHILNVMSYLRLCPF